MDDKQEKERKWPHLTPVPTGDPPLEPVVFYREPPTNAEPISCTDPLGSYTGTPIDGGEPVQDADDL